MAKNKEKKPSLKETDPYRYYRRQARWLSVGKWTCVSAPIVAVITTYLVKANMNAANTNPIDPIKFPIGLSLAAIVGIVSIVLETKKAGKEAEKNGTGVNFTGAIGWGVAALILYFCYLTVFYLVILCAAEFVGQVGAVICKAEIKEKQDLMNKIQTAEINADAFRRKSVSVGSEVTKKKEEKKADPIE